MLLNGHRYGAGFALQVVFVFMLNFPCFALSCYSLVFCFSFLRFFILFSALCLFYTYFINKDCLHPTSLVFDKYPVFLNTHDAWPLVRAISISAISNINSGSTNWLQHGDFCLFFFLPWHMSIPKIIRTIIYSPYFSFCKEHWWILEWQLDSIHAWLFYHSQFL